MGSTANKIMSAAAALFGSSLIQQGFAAVNDPLAFTNSFGVPLKIPSETNYVRVAGIRELFFGVAIVGLIVADKLNAIRDGSRAAALTTAAAACVGFSDALLTRDIDTKVAVGHAQGGAVLAVIAFGLWFTAP